MAATPATNLTIVSSGIQDTRLQPTKGNPDIAQFLKVYQKTTRWSAQWNRIEFDGSAEFGQRVSLTIPPLAELVSGFNIVVTMPDILTTQLAAIRDASGTDLQNRGNFLGPLYGWTNSLGHALIQQIDLEIGGAIVESLTGQQLEILDELYETLESSIAKDAMIKRAPNGFTSQTFLSTNTTVYVPIPFWFSRPGIYSHALPIDALRSDRVRIHVTFRPITQLFYTDARVDSRTVGYRPGVDSENGTMWSIIEGRFWRQNAQATGRVYSMNATIPTIGVSGELIPYRQFPSRFTPQDAYALIEYISLEEFEALRFRSAELTYHVEQHYAVPVEQSLGQTEARIVIPYTNPTKEIHWVLQRPEAELYNAWFLFTRDLAPAMTKNICNIPWWSDAQLEPSEDTHWAVVPAFQNAYSEPLHGATLLYNSYERYIHEGGSFFRSVIPALYYEKTAIRNRYIYAYNFGQRGERLKYGATGAANWDKIPRKELFLTLNRGRGGIAPPNMNLYIYTTIWNVFKVFGGRGGMLFSN